MKVENAATGRHYEHKPAYRPVLPKENVCQLLWRLAGQLRTTAIGFRFLGAWLATFGFMGTAGAQTAAPPNDYFTNRQVIIGSTATIQGSNIGATTEPDDPFADPFGLDGEPLGHSVWYTWTAPFSGGTVIEISATDFQTPVLGVWTGDSLSALSLVDNGTSTFRLARLAFNVVVGQTYQIGVDGGNFAQSDTGTGNFTLSLNLSPPPNNDSFASATVIPGNYFTASGSFLGASRELGEPIHGGSPDYANFPQTLWWSWAAPTNTGAQSLPVSLTADAVSFPPVLAVYTGNSVSNLTPVPFSFQTNGMTSVGRFTALPGTNYQIALAGQEQDREGIDISPRYGNYRFRLNTSALTLEILNLVTNENPADSTVQFTADARVENVGAALSSPLRVSVSLISGISVIGQDAGVEVTSNILVGVSRAFTLAVGQSFTITNIEGTIPAPSTNAEGIGVGYGAYAELQEQPVSNLWFAVDQEPVAFGDWPSLNGGNNGPGGGVIRLDPDYISSSTFSVFKSVQIYGPTNIFPNDAVQFAAQAFYSSTNFWFTNSLWSSSLFTITNGLLTVGQVSSNTLVTVRVAYEYGGYFYTNSRAVTILLLPSFSISLPELQGRIFSASVLTIPGLTYVLEFKDHIADPSWSTADQQIGDGTPKRFHDASAAITMRFYRIRAHY
jgi:hypothetical protein